MELLYAAAFSAALSTDALLIGFTCSMRGIRVSPGARFTVCLVSAAVTAAAVLAGGALCSLVPESVGRIAGGCMLAALGLYVIIGALKRKNRGEYAHGERADESGPLQESALKKAVRTVAGILKSPGICDADSSKVLDCREALYLGAALSADSFAAGIGAGLGGAGLSIPIFCALMQLVFIFAGEAAGRRLRKMIKPDERLLTASSGLILIISGVLRLLLRDCQ